MVSVISDPTQLIQHDPPITANGNILIVSFGEQSFDACLIDEKNTKFISVKEDSVSKLLEKVVKAAPPKDGLNMFMMPRKSSYKVRSEAVNAFVDAGYKSIRLVDLHALAMTYMLHLSGVKCAVGDLVLLVSACPFDDYSCWMDVVKKTEAGFEAVALTDKGSLELLMKYPNIKHLVAEQKINFAPAETKILKKKLGKNFHTVDMHVLVTHDIIMSINKGGNFDGYLVNDVTSAVFKVKYDNKEALVGMHAVSTPAHKVVKLDVGDADHVFVEVSYNDGPFTAIKGFKFKEPGNRKVEVIIDIDAYSLPKVAVNTVECVKDVKPPAGAVLTGPPVMYKVNYDSSKNAFTGCCVMPDGSTTKSISAKGPKDLFAALQTQKPKSPYSGVLLDYTCLQIPMKTHLQVIKALPHPKADVCCLPFQFTFSIALWLTKVSAKLGEYITLTLRRGDGAYYESVVLEKMKTGFKAVATGYQAHHCYDYTKVVVITAGGLNGCCRHNIELLHPGKEILVADIKRCTSDAKINFARHYFAGTDFDGYMVERHSGMRFVLKCNDESAKFDKIIDWDFKDHTESIPVSSYESKGELTLKFYGDENEEVIHTFTVPKGTLGKSRKAVLKLSVDRFLVPTVKITIEPEPNPKPFDLPLYSTDRLKGMLAHQSNNDPCVITVISDSKQSNSYLPYYRDMSGNYYEGFNSFNELALSLAKFCEEKNVVLILDHYGEKISMADRQFRRRAYSSSVYPKVKPVNSFVFTWSLHLTRAKIGERNIPIGEKIVMFNEFAVVLQRVAKGFKVIDLTKHSLLETCQKHNVNIIVHFTDESEICKTKHAALSKRLAPRTILTSCTTNNIDLYPDYFWSHQEKNDFHGCIIEEFVNFNFTMCWGKQRKTFETGYVTPPHHPTIELDLGDAMELTVAAYPVENFCCNIPQIIKTFKMKSKRRRCVILTFNVLDAFNVTTSLVVKETADVLLLQRCANGFQQSIHSNYATTKEPKCVSSIESVINSYPNPNGTSLVIDVTTESFKERQRLVNLAQQRGFDAVVSLHGFCVGVNKLILTTEGFKCDVGEVVLLIDENGRGFVLQGKQKEYTVLKSSKNLKKLADDYPAIKQWFVAEQAASLVSQALEKQKTTILKPLESSKATFYQYLMSRAKPSNEFKHPVVESFAGLMFNAKSAKKTETIEASFEAVPYSREVVLYVGEASELKILATSAGSSKAEHVEVFPFQSAMDRVVTIKLAVDKHLVPSAVLLRTERVPNVSIKLTPDNQVLIRGDSTYTGDKMIPAYVSYKDGVHVGALAKQHLETDPELVVYDIVQLLSDEVNQLWEFAVSKDETGQIVVQVGNIYTTADTLFATVVKATLGYIQNHSGGATIDEIGVQLPSSALISDKLRKNISAVLNAKLFVYPY